MADPTPDLIASEEAKRDRHWRPGQRWAAFMAAVDWADRQQPVRRNTREGCLRKQRELLAQTHEIPG